MGPSSHSNVISTVSSNDQESSPSRYSTSVSHTCGGKSSTNIPQVGTNDDGSDDDDDDDDDNPTSTSTSGSQVVYFIVVSSLYLLHRKSIRLDWSSSVWQ